MKTVLVIFGGRSAEHDVSIITAHIPIISSLQAAGGYYIWPLYIAKNGTWYSDQAMTDLAWFREGLEEKLARLKPVQLRFADGLTLVWPGVRPKTVKIDVAFPAMHGTYGEDGTLMGVLRMAGVPFVGCDLEASVIAMDKVLAKQVTEPLGIPSVKYVWFSAVDWADEPAGFRDHIAKLNFPLFVKPVHLGSSIAITRVDRPEDLDNAIEVALHYDDKVIVEQAVENLIEVTLPIIGNRELRLAVVEQPLAKFFGFEEKYLQGQKKGGEGANSGYSQIPADIPPEMMAAVRKLGEQTYRAIGASGIARVDFLIDSESGQIYMNEINTLPGSLYAHNWKKAGVSGVELVTELIRLAEERFSETQKRVYTFDSTILDQVRGPKISDQ